MVMRSTSNVFGQLRGFVNDARTEFYSHLPSKVGDHLIGAKKELLAAIREIIDTESETIDSQWDAAKERKAGRRASQASNPDTGSDS
jgi:hypothetical protein